MFTKKIETIPFRDFLAGGTKKEKSHKPTLPIYGFMGMNITPDSMFSNFNTPYIVVFTVAGVVIASAIIEHALIAHGHERTAEAVESFTRFIMPIAFYTFLAISIFKVL